MQRILLGAIIVAAAAWAVPAEVTFDGVLDMSPGAEWGSPAASAVQDNHTGFGDQVPAGYSGSELDELYVMADEYYLYVGVTGNLEQNGNAFILLIETGNDPADGQNVLATEIAPMPVQLPCADNGPPYAVQHLGQSLVLDDGGTPEDPSDDLSRRSDDPAATVLDEDFEPNVAIAVDAFDGIAHVTQYDLSAASLGTWDDPATNNDPYYPCGDRIETLDYYASRVFRGEVGVNAGHGVLWYGDNPNSSEYAFNNTGYAGVTGSAVSAPGSGLAGDPRTQTTGLEAKIALADLGFSPPVYNQLSMKIAVLLTSGDGFVSNQVLPGVGAGADTTNLGFRPDFTAFANEQYVSFVSYPDWFFGTVDGETIVSDFGTSNCLASQNTVTGFGDRGEVPDLLSPGSELDQLLVQNGLIVIGITGNLQPNGNNLILWLDTVSGAGEGLTMVLDANGGPHWEGGGRVYGHEGDTIPLDADYAVVLNTGGGVVYVDLVDLANDTSTYVGTNAIGSGEGDLEVGDPPVVVPGWQVALNNTNVGGVNGDLLTDPYTQADNAALVTTGFEIKIPLEAVGSPAPGTSVNIFAMIAGEGGYLSNQVLPAGQGGGQDNFGDGPTDLSSLGYGCLSLVIAEEPPSCYSPPQDVDGDNDVDLADFGMFSACFNGPNRPWSSTADQRVCSCFDQDEDDDVDLADFGMFSACFNGPNRPPAAGCP